MRRSAEQSRFDKTYCIAELQKSHQIESSYSNKINDDLNKTSELRLQTILQS